MIEKELEFILKTKDVQEKLLKTHLQNNNEQLYSISYSELSPECFLYQSEIEGFPKFKLFKKIPKNLEGKFENKYDNGKIITSRQLDVNWLNIWLYNIKDELGNNLVIQYGNTIKKPEIDQLYIQTFDNENKIIQQLFYHTDDNFVKYDFKYTEDGILSKMKTIGFWGGLNRGLHTADYTFVFEKTELRQIAVKQSNGIFQVYPKK